MNKFTKLSQFKQTPEFILNNSDLLIKEDCRIVEGVLYEHCKKDLVLYKDECYRFFFSVDDYDYVEDKEMIEKLDRIFKGGV